MIKLIPIVGSTQVRSAGYDTFTRTMRIDYYDGGVYDYADVPLELYVRFLRSESKGSFLAHEVKGIYSYCKLAEAA